MSHRNLSVDLKCKSFDWFLCDEKFYWKVFANRIWTGIYLVPNNSDNCRNVKKQNAVVYFDFFRGRRSSSTDTGSLVSGLPWVLHLTLGFHLYLRLFYVWTFCLPETFIVYSEIYFIKNSYHIETCQLIWSANHLTGFYVMRNFTERYLQTEYEQEFIWSQTTVITAEMSKNKMLLFILTFFVAGAHLQLTLVL